MKEFGSYHPIVNFIFFTAVTAFSMTILQPVLLTVSLLCAVAYLAVLSDVKVLLGSLRLTVPLMIFTAVLNPLFNHEGVTILCYFPNGNPLTLESVIYGICAGLTVASVITWFSCLNRIITSDKIIYLFGRVLPSVSLIFSMVLSFVPKFKARVNAVYNGQKCLGKKITTGSVAERARVAVTVISALATWSLENGVETAESMKSRGYGLKGRTAYSNYKISKRDVILIAVMLLCCAVIIYSAFSGITAFAFFPKIGTVAFNAASTAVYIIHFLFCFLPVIIELKEDIKWKFLKSKI